jgi:hypothetical protein
MPDCNPPGPDERIRKTCPAARCFLLFFDDGAISSHSDSQISLKEMDFTRFLVMKVTSWKMKDPFHGKEEPLFFP